MPKELSVEERLVRIEERLGMRAPKEEPKPKVDAPEAISAAPAPKKEGK